VTRDAAHPHIAAVVEGVIPSHGSGPKVVLPVARRFLYGAKVSMDVFYKGSVDDEDRDYPRRAIPYTGLNRGILVRPYADHPWPLQLRDGTREHVYGWPIGMDSAFTPSSEACLRGWQQVLWHKPLPPLLLNEAISTAPTSEDPRVFIAATVGGLSHGLANCLRDLLRLAAATLPVRLCAVEPSQITQATGGAGAGCGLSASGPCACSANGSTTLEYSAMFFGATFALVPAGDALDRDEAMLQALEGGAIPVFFGGNSRGDLTREAYSRTLMGTEDADSWSVLVDDKAARIAGAVELRKVLKYNGPEAQLDILDDTGMPIFHETGSTDVCEQANATRAGEELLAILGAVPRGRVQSMANFIVESLPARTSMLYQRVAGVDFVDRLVLAMLAADTTVPRPPANQSGGTWLTWPAGI